MSASSMFYHSDPMMSGFGAATNKKNYSNPGYAINPMKSGSFANAGLNVIMPGMGMVAGKGGGDAGTSYANNQLDIASAGARDFIARYLKSNTAEQKKAFDEQIQRGIENRTNVKMMENERALGPHLKATDVKGIPGFLGSGNGLVSGADRGTGYGSALEGAIAAGQSTTPDQKVELGAKGTPTGLKNEVVPKFQANPAYQSILTPKYILDTQAFMQAQNQNQPKGGK